MQWANPDFGAGFRTAGRRARGPTHDRVRWRTDDAIAARLAFLVAACGDALRLCSHARLQNCDLRRNRRQRGHRGHQVRGRRNHGQFGDAVRRHPFRRRHAQRRPAARGAQAQPAAGYAGTSLRPWQGTVLLEPDRGGADLRSGRWHFVLRGRAARPVSRTNAGPDVELHRARRRRPLRGLELRHCAAPVPEAARRHAILESTAPKQGPHAPIPCSRKTQRRWPVSSWPRSALRRATLSRCLSWMASLRS